MKRIVLKTVRPFVFRIFDHKNRGKDSSNPQEDTIKLVHDVINSMIDETKTQIHADEPKQPKLPLIRLIFQIHNELQAFNPIRIGQQYTGRVANPEDMILLRKLTNRKRFLSVYDIDDIERNIALEVIIIIY